MNSSLHSLKGIVTGAWTVIAVLMLSAGVAFVHWPRPAVRRSPARTALPSTASSPHRVRIYRSEAKPPPRSHPKHAAKVWLTKHKDRTFRVIQLPRCQHMEALISYSPIGETLQQAKKRLGGAAAMTGSFHHPKTMALADFFQRKGSVISEVTTGRWFLAIVNGEVSAISDNYMLVRGKSETSVIALGQRLVPLHRDGFSLSFMNQVTDRMALGLNKRYLFIVQGKSDIWRLADFMNHKLPCKIAINADGGHVVRGRAPTHIVFRWRSSQGLPLLAKARREQ